MQKDKINLYKPGSSTKNGSWTEQYNLLFEKGAICSSIPQLTFSLKYPGTRGEQNITWPDCGGGSKKSL